MRNMTIALMIAAVTTILITPQADAATTSSKEETIGVGTGAAASTGKGAKNSPRHGQRY